MSAGCRVLLSLLVILALSAHRPALGQVVPASAAAVAAKTDAAAPAVPKPPTMGKYPRFKELLWSGDGQWLLAKGDFNYLAAFSPRDGRMGQMLELDDHPSAFATFAGANQLAVGTNDGTVEIWDTRSFKMNRRYRVAESYNTYAVALSADGKRFASCGASDDPRIKLWSVADGSLLHTLGEPNSGGGSMVFSPDSARLAAVAHNELRVWKVADATPVNHLRVHILRGSLRYAADGKTLIVIEPGMITFWNPDDDAPPKVVLAPESIAPHPPKTPHSYWIANSSGAIFAGATDLSPDEKSTASITKEGTVAIWSLETGQLERTLPAAPVPMKYPDSVQSLVYSPDGHQLAAVTLDTGEVIFWDVP